MTTATKVIGETQRDEAGDEEAVVALALEGLDASDRDIRLAIDDFRKRHQEARAEEDASVVFARIADPETLALVAECHRGWIRAHAAGRKVRLAEARLKLANERVKQAIREREDVDPDAEWAVNCHRLEVVSASAPLRDVFLFAKGLVLATGGDSPDGAAIDRLPGPVQRQIAANPSLGAFLKDLLALVTSGQVGARELLREILATPGVAERARHDEGLPPPARFLADLVVTCSAASEE